MYFLVLYSNYFFYLPFQTWEAQTVTPQHLLNATITLWSQTYILGFKMSITPKKLQIVICCGIMICVGFFLSLFWKIFFGGGKAFCFVFNKTEEWSRVLNVNEAGIMSQDLGEKKSFTFSKLTFGSLHLKKNTMIQPSLLSSSPQVPYFLAVLASDSFFAIQLLEITFLLGSMCHNCMFQHTRWHKLAYYTSD